MMKTLFEAMGYYPVAFLMTFTGHVMLGQTPAGAPATGWDVTGMVTEFGGLGLAVYLVLYQLHVTNPEHRKERQQDQEAFKAELKEIRKEFKENLERVACRAVPSSTQR